MTRIELIQRVVHCVAGVKPEMLQNLDFIQAQRHGFPFIYTYISNTTKAYHTNTKILNDVSSWSYANVVIFRCIFNLTLSSL